MGLDDLRAVRRTVVALGYEQNESEARPFLQHEDSVVRELALGALHRMHSLTNADLELALRATIDLFAAAPLNLERSIPKSI